MKTIETTIDIDAPTAVVWATLLDFAAYSDWNPFVQHVAGDPTVGSRLRVRIAPPGGRAMTFKPHVTSLEPEARLEWLGRLGVRGLFDGRHEFRLESIDGDRTRLTHSESFSGLLVGILLDEDAIRAGFESMNEALKDRVEGVDAAMAARPDETVSA